LHHIHVSAVQTVPLPPMLGQVLGVANADFAGRQEADGRLRMTISTGDWHHPAGPLAPDEIQPPAYMVSTIIERGAYVLPAVREARINRVWGGLLDMTPDGLPVIERTPGVEGLIVAAGFSGHGFCLGPITGQLIAALVTEATPCCPLDPFRLARFATVETDASPELLG
ncbi:MAG: FAD-binding oxidoreductase, partial [Caldilinea sp.]|nr:FAD-binding oxidoreductase [Caldilinea sp.]